MLWADSVSMAYLINRIPYVSIRLRILTHLKVFEATQMKCDTAFGIRRVTRLSEADTFVDSIYGARAWVQITQSLGGSLDTSKGSKNSRSFEDSGRSDEEYSKDGASSKEGGSETPHVRRSTRESMALVRYSPSANYLLLTENGEPVLFRSLE
ncbi:hypothetical protein Tco_0129886 [Tanacetum coccineum]